MCSEPVGLGAKRVRTGILGESVTSEIAPKNSENSGIKCTTNAIKNEPDAQWRN